MFDERATLQRGLDKITRTARRIQDRIPYRTINGRFDDWTDQDISWWTNGFWPGILWLAFRQTGNPDLARHATGAELHLDRALADFHGLHHDVGFMWHISSVARYKIQGDVDSRRRGLLVASILASRFNLAGRFIRAWNSNWGEGNTGWAIIDCLMNLPLLWWASQESKDPRFAHIAVAHTETVLKHFIYPDGSSKHIVEFDPHTGAYVKNYGGQGYSDSSAWSRGCAWALHGLALAAGYTGRADFLATAELVAEFFLNNLPADMVPWADFKAPRQQDKDSSAAACAASGLLSLARSVPAPRRPRYENGARNILASLSAHYANWEGDEALLQHGCVAYDTSDRPGWNDTSLIYGDYFYLEALIKLQGGDGLF